MSTKKLKVGFDLDGVLLYNPARIMRPLIKTYKSFHPAKKKVSFVLPKSPLQIFIWKILHLSSVFPAPGYSIIKGLVEADLIEAYIITARYSSLHENTSRWFNYLNRDNLFKECIENTESEQPHYYKEAQIRTLNLDIFVDDNWDIVHHLATTFKQDQTEVLWVSNILDSRISYEHKFYSLQNVMRYIQEKVLP